MSESDHKLGGGRHVKVQNKVSTRPCVPWMQGYCRLGTECRDRHDEKDKGFFKRNHPEIQDLNEDQLKAVPRSDKYRKPASSLKRSPDDDSQSPLPRSGIHASSNNNLGRHMPSVKDQSTNRLNEINLLGNYPCWAWKAGYCSQGEACPFKHEDEIPPSINIPSNGNGLDDAQSQRGEEAENREHMEMGRLEREQIARKAVEEKLRQEQLKKQEAAEMEQKRVQEAQRVKFERERIVRAEAEEGLRLEKARKKRAEEEAKRRAAEEAKKRLEEEAKKRAEEEAKIRAEEEANKSATEKVKKRSEESVHEYTWKYEWGAALAIEKQRRKEAQELQQELAVDHNIYKEQATYRNPATEQCGLGDDLAEDPKKSPQFTAPSEKTTMQDHTVKVEDESPIGYYQSQLDEYLSLHKQLSQEGLLHDLQPQPPQPFRQAPIPNVYLPAEDEAARQEASTQHHNALLDLQILRLRKELQDRAKEAADTRKTEDHLAETRHEEVIRRMDELRRLGRVSPEAQRPVQPETPAKEGSCIVA